MHSTGSPWTRSKSKGDRVSCLHALQPTCSILQQSSFTGEGLPLSPHRNDPLPARRSSFTVFIIPKPHRRSRQNVIFCRSACHELSVECATGSEQVKRNQQSRQLTVYSASYLRRISCTFTRPMPWPLSFLVVAGRSAATGGTCAHPQDPGRIPYLGVQPCAAKSGDRGRPPACARMALSIRFEMTMTMSVLSKGRRLRSHRSK